VGRISAAGARAYSSSGGSSSSTQGSSTMDIDLTGLVAILVLTMAWLTGKYKEAQ
jgi:hypothetical protein